MRTGGLVFLALFAGCAEQGRIAETTETEIGPSGGDAYSADRRLHLLFPAGAFLETTAVRIETLRAAPIDGQLGPLYHLAPDGLETRLPFQIQFSTPESWRGELLLAASDGRFERLKGTRLDAEERVIRARAMRFGCAEPACTKDDACAGGTSCIEGHCAAECLVPQDCLSQGGGCDEHGRCMISSQVPPLQPDEPAIGCHPTPLGLFALEREHPCRARFCGDACSTCGPAASCMGGIDGRCNLAGECDGGAVSCDPSGQVEGWDDPPGSGLVFILDSLALSPQDTGFDLDGRCRGPSDCIDNALWQFGQFGNDELRQRLLGGETLVMIELAGIDQPFDGSDRSLTIKLYTAIDDDVPPFPANNFAVPPGESDCCKFKIDPRSLDGRRLQARVRAPARIDRGRLEVSARSDLELGLFLGTSPQSALRLERGVLSASVPSNHARLEAILFGGVAPIASLAGIANPYCAPADEVCHQKFPGTSFLDLIALAEAPDIDLSNPPNGLDTLAVSDGRIRECVSGNGSFVPPLDPAEPWSCALDPRIEDGYSVAIVATAIAVSVTGIANP